MKDIIKKDKEKIEELITRNVSEIIDKDHLKYLLLSGKKLRIKLGIDPTGPDIHLGRAVSLRKLREFQNLGHQIILIIGDFTGLVGDASDKKNTRPMLTKEQVKKNMSGYPEQIGKILDVKKIEFHYNSEWLSRLTMKDIIPLASLFTVHQMINRRNFKERFEEKQNIGLHELLYPLLQGYDSMAVKSDVEIGGTDQLFNLKAGRKIQEFYNQKPQDIFMLEMLPGLDGEKMSTTLGNIIAITDSPNDMYGKVMSIRDDLIGEYFLRCTDISQKEAEEITEKIKTGGLNPLNAKINLASEIVKIYSSKEAAEKAKDYFKKTFQDRRVPEEIPEIKTQKGEFLADILIKAKILNSKSAFRRLIKEKAIEMDGKALKDVNFKINKTENIKIGKRKFLKTIIE